MAGATSTNNYGINRGSKMHQTRPIISTYKNYVETYVENRFLVLFFLLLLKAQKVIKVGKEIMETG